MPGRLQLEVVTPRRKLLEVDADEVRLPGVLGELGVLPGHTPLLTALGTGPLSYYEGTTATRIVVQDGFAEVLPDQVTVLAAMAETAAEIDAAAARDERAAAEEALKGASAEELDGINACLRLAEARLAVAG